MSALIDDSTGKSAKPVAEVEINCSGKQDELHLSLAIHIRSTCFI